MRIDDESLAALLKLQQVDLDGLKAQKQLDALPQREVIAQCRAQRRTVQAKLDQIANLKRKAEDEIEAIMDEDSRLAQKQRRLEGEIDEVKGDFRSVEARTKELGGCSKRRAALDEKLSAAEAELKQVEGLEAQALQMMESLAAKEDAATAEFVEKGTALKARCAEVNAVHARLVELLPADLVREYDRATARSGGVGVARLQGQACGACRSSIDAGRLAAMKAQGNLASCPHCKRLLILQ